MFSADLESEVIFEVAEALRVPVLVLTVLALGVVLIELGGFAVEERIAHRVTLEARRRGAIVRPLGDVVVLMPPLAIADRDLRRLVEITGESIAAATAASQAPAPLALGAAA